MAIRSQADIVSNINTDLADNNAGLISASDVRENMKDIAESINTIVGSGDFDSTNPFTGADVRAAKNSSGQYGSVVVESGIRFANGFDNGIQIHRYPGPGGISHTGIADLSVGNPHTQYLHTNGLNKVVGNLPMGEKWINSSGNLDALNTTMNNHGLQFEYVIASDREIIHVGSKSTVEFDTDNSIMSTAKSVAQAWIRFNGASGNLVVNSSFNVSGIQHVNNGHYKIFFTPNTFSDANYVAIGNSNAVAGSGSAQDFDVNTVGIVDRTKDYLTYLVKSDDNEYVNAYVNDLVVFGNASGVTATTIPGGSITQLPT